MGDKVQLPVCAPGRRGFRCPHVVFFVADGLVDLELECQEMLWSWVGGCGFLDKGGRLRPDAGGVKADI
jgi:hypothetical protein